MQPNKLELNSKNYARASRLNNHLSQSLMLLSLLALGAVFYASKGYAVEMTSTKANLFEEKYQEQNNRQLKSLSATPKTTLELGKNQEEDITQMLENGYDMMGTSEFVSESIPAELAQTYGKKIKADVVLVYEKPLSLGINMVSLDGTEDGKKTIDDANQANAKNLKTLHYASYWAKVPMPLFGVHVVKLVKTSANPAEEGVVQPGLKILAVIKQSPAAKANISTGDTLLKIGEVELEKADDLFAAVKQYQGQSVEVIVRHGEEDIKTTVTLNSRK